MPIGSGARHISGNHAPLFVNGEILEGMIQCSVTGRTAQFYQVRNTLSTATEQVPDIPASGGGQIVLNYNSAIPLHRMLKEFQENNTIVTFRWLLEGKTLNGVNTSEGDPQPPLEVVSVASSGLLTPSTNNSDLPAVGDYLTPGSGETLLVASVDYSDPNGLRFNVTQVDGSAPSAVASSSTYAVTKPAQEWRFSARIGGLPRQGGQIMTATVTLALTGDIAEINGTPDLPTS